MAEKRNSRNGNSYEDKELTCVECGQQFPFTAGEQDYFARRGFENPKRCKPCCEKRRQEKALKAANQQLG